MEKLNKQKIIAVVLVIALIAALCGAVSLLYNSIEMLSYTPFEKYIDPKYEILSEFYDAQKPLAIISLVAAILAFIGVAAGVSAFVVKKNKYKAINILICVVAVIAFIVFLILTNQTWLGFYKEEYKSSYERGKPFSVRGTFQSGLFTIYSAVMSALLQQLVYSVIIAAAIFVSYKIDANAAVKSTAPETDEDDEDDN